ncbi:MAG: hypothetical protein ABIG34_03440 [Candidatus Peregrinibacteria bacterium]
MIHFRIFHVRHEEARLTHFAGTPEQPGNQPERQIGRFDILERGERAFNQSNALVDRMDKRVAALQQINGRLNQQLTATPSPALRQKITAERQLIAQQIAAINTSRAELIQRYNETMRGFSTPKDVFKGAEQLDQVDSVINAFAQRVHVIESDLKLGAMLQQTKSAEQELRGDVTTNLQKTDTMYNSYNAKLTQMYGGKEAREAQEGVAEAENALQQAEVDAVVGGLNDLKAQRVTLDTERKTKQKALNKQKRLLDTAKTTLKAETDAKTKAEAWPAEIDAHEQALQAAKDVVVTAQDALDDKHAAARAEMVEEKYLTPPKELDAINLRIADATAAKVGKGPGQIAVIEAQRVKDMPLIREFYKAKKELTAEVKKRSAAQKKVTESQKKVDAEEVALTIAAVPGKPLKERIETVIEARQKRIDEEQKKVQPMEDQVKAAEQEMEDTFTNPLKELDAQIKGLEDPIAQATEAVRKEKAKVSGLRVVVARPSDDQKTAFLTESGKLLKQINEEGRFMRNHFSGEQEVEDRTIKLVKQRTDVATEIAKRSGKEEDVRKALDYTKEELRWLNRNADQHPERIAVLMGLERSLNKQYVLLLTASTNKILLTGTPEQKVTAIERELQYLPGVDGVGMRAREKKLSNPVAGPARGLLQKARDLQYAPLRGKTTAALTDEPPKLDGGKLENALAATLEEWRFLKRTNHVPVEGGALDTGRLQFLAGKYLDIKRVIANRSMNTLKKGVQESNPTKLLAGVQQIEADIAKNESPQRVQQLTTMLGEQLPKIAGVIDANVNVALTSGKSQDIVKAMDVVRNELALHARRPSTETPRREGELRTAYAALLNAMRSITETACVSAGTGEVDSTKMSAAFSMLYKEEQQLKSAPKLAMLVSAKQPDGTWTQKRIPQIPLNCQERLRSINARRDELANKLSQEIDSLQSKKNTLDAGTIARTIALIDLEKKVSSVWSMVNETRAAERLVLRGQLEAIKPQVKKSERKTAKAVDESARLDKSRDTIALEEFLTNEIDPVLQECERETADPAQIKEMRKKKNKDKRTARMAKFDSMHVSLRDKMATAPTGVLKTRVDKAMKTILQLRTRYRLLKENKQWIEEEMSLRSSDVDTLINNIDSATSKNDLKEAITQAKKYAQAITEWALTVDAATYDTAKVVDALQQRLTDAVTKGEAILARM